MKLEKIINLEASKLDERHLKEIGGFLTA